MNNFKENKGASRATVTIVILVILLLVAVGGCVYLYKKGENKNLVTVAEDEQVKAGEIMNNVVTTVAEKASEITETTKTMTADEQYKTFVNNLKNDMLKFDSETGKEKLYREYESNEYDYDGKQHYAITLTGKGVLKLNETEISKNVIKFDVAYTGNGGWKNLYFIKDDGTVSYMCIDEFLDNKKIEIKTIKNLKNIVSIVGGITGERDYPASCEAFFIDIEGHVFDGE